MSDAGRDLLKRRYLSLIQGRKRSTDARPRNWAPSTMRLVVKKRRRESTLWMRKLSRVKAELPGRWVKVKTYKTRGVARQTVVNLRRGARFEGGAKVPPGVFEFTAVGFQVWAVYRGEGGSNEAGKQSLR